MKYLHQAIQVAIKGRGDKHYNLGAVAIRGDGSVVSACNLMTRVPTPTAHAEVRTLRKAGKGSILFISRVMADGKWGMARPCKNCRRVIKQYKVKKVYYTISDGEYGVWRP